MAKRFFRNRLAVTGLSILVFMFLFSFVGGLVSPYTEAQIFYRYDLQRKEFASVTENTEFRFAAADSARFDAIIQAQMILAIQKQSETFSYRDTDYSL